MKPEIRVYRKFRIDKEWTEIAQSISNFFVGKYKLNYPNIDFYIVSPQEISKLIATNAHLIHPIHWSVAQDYYLNEFQRKLYGTYVLEIVGEKTDHIKAYISEDIADHAKKLVIAHVLGHAHVDSNNKIAIEVLEKFDPNANVKLAQKVYDYSRLYGREEVQYFIECLYSISNLIDIYQKEEKEPLLVESLQDYNISERFKRFELENEIGEKKEEIKYPKRKERDVLKVLAKYAQLENWERDLLEGFRELFYRNYYLARLKILHEGFASLIHWLFILDYPDLTLDEVRKMAIEHNYVIYEPQYGEEIEEGYNPYFLGFHLLLHAWIKFSKGNVGIEYESKRYWYERVKDLSFKFSEIELVNQEAWDNVLWIVRNYDDYNLILDYFDEEFFNRWGKRYFVYESDKYPAEKRIVTARDFENVKQTFMFRTFNYGMPRVFIPEDGARYNSKIGEIAELYIVHDISEVAKGNILPQQLTLRKDSVIEVLKRLYRIWKKPVNLETFKVDYSSLDEMDLIPYWYWYYYLLFPGSVEDVPKPEIVKLPIKKVIVRFDGKDINIIEKDN